MVTAAHMMMLAKVWLDRDPTGARNSNCTVPYMYIRGVDRLHCGYYVGGYYVVAIMLHPRVSCGHAKVGCRTQNIIATT